MYNHIKICVIFINLCNLCSCTSDYVPKPKGYNRIDLPDHKYQILKEVHPYIFEYGTVAKILQDTSWLAQPHWIEIHYTDFKAVIHLTYEPLHNDMKAFAKLIDDAHKLTAKHQVKAYSIEETLIKTPAGMNVIIFELSGEVPSQFQFYATDTTTHFLRGALYFHTAVKNDSLAPVIDYMKVDVMHLINTLKWR